MDDDRRGGGGGGGALEWWNIRDCSPSDRDEFIRREEGDRKKTIAEYLQATFPPKERKKKKKPVTFGNFPFESLPFCFDAQPD